MSCKGCLKRHVGCHSDCEDYAEQCEKRKTEKEKINSKLAAKDFLIESCQKSKRRLKIP